MTKEKLIENATALKAKVNIESPKFIGVQYHKSFVWHWFDIGATGEVWFNHSYSQNTGATKKGLAHRMKIYSYLGFHKNV